MTTWLSASERARATVIGSTDSVSAAVAARADLFLSAPRRRDAPRGRRPVRDVRRGRPRRARPVAGRGGGDGRTFPDALAAVPAAAVNGAPLLLVPGDCTPAETGAYVEGNAALRGVLVVGDSSAVADDALERVC